MLSYYLLISSV